jgi:hypothetical protein
MKKWALITGATGGMGNVYIHEMIQRGYNLVLVGRNPNKMDKLKNQLINENTIDIVYMTCDLAKGDEIKKLFDDIGTFNIKFDFILNVAGIENEDWFNTVSLKDTLDIIKTNVLATTHIIKKSLYCKKDNMYILNVSSMAGFFPIPMKAVYSSTKRYLIELTRVLNYELKEQGVRVSVVCPAGMPTKDVIKRKIDSQGIFGKLTTMETKVVVRKSVDKALKGKVVFVPGMLNLMLLRLSYFIPRGVLLNILGHRWKRTNKKMKLHL